MQTRVLSSLLATEAGREAESILRACVHCGFCTATCPTYQLLGDELDGPRGRIYQIKQVLEGIPPSTKTLQHLDRCLTCRNCETTCPSGVQYGRLLDFGREQVTAATQRPWFARLQRWGMRQVLPYPRRFAALLRVGQALRPLLPPGIKRKVPQHTAAVSARITRHARKVLMLEGCVQPALAPNINQATRRVLDRLGIQVVDANAGCCGALSHHMTATEQAEVFMKRNIDAWWPALEAGAEAIIINASGCGTQVKDYGRLLAHDGAYADKAQQVAGRARDLGEFLAQEDLSALGRFAKTRHVAFHPPCTLQHGQQLQNVVEPLLEGLGLTLTPISDAHLCCGSAGTYSITQPELSRQLRERKLQSIQAGQPELIASANIGCIHHLAEGTDLPVRHWVELVDELIR